MSVSQAAQATFTEGVAPVCPICQKTRFVPAPNGRMSRRGLPPLCAGCKSLERHRAGRALMEALRDRDLFKDFSLLQFSDDGIVAKGWFRGVETSLLDAPGALDPAAIAKPDGSVDCLVSCHIITKVPDHKAAVRELARVLSPRGIAFLSFPNPLTRAESVELGISGPAKGRDYRILGLSFEPELYEMAKGTHIAAVHLHDPVTGDPDLAYVLMKDFLWMRRIVTTKLEARFLDIGD